MFETVAIYKPRTWKRYKEEHSFWQNENKDSDTGSKLTKEKDLQDNLRIPSPTCDTRSPSIDFPIDWTFSMEQILFSLLEIQYWLGQ